MAAPDPLPAQGLPPGLVPTRDLASEADGSWRIIGAAPGFELDHARYAGSWILCTAEMKSEVSIVGLALQVRRAGTGRAQITHLFATSQEGRSAWIGYVPEDVERVRVEVVTSSDTFRIRRFAVRRLSRARLVLRALLIDAGDTLAAIRWRVLGKKVRARGIMEAVLRTGLGRSIGAGSTDGYPQWLLLNDHLPAEDLEEFRTSAEAWPDPPLISVLMPVYNPNPEDLDAAIGSVRAQLYPHWELRIADDASTDPRVRAVLEQAAAADARIHVAVRPQNGHISAASNTALETCRGRYVALMDHDDLIPAHALLFVAHEIVQRPELDLIYSDEDKVDERGRRYMPHFKSDWNEELFLTQNYVNHLGVYRTEIMRRIGGFRVGLEGSQDHDMVLRFLDHTDETRIRHIPRILYHWRNHRQTASFSEKSMEKAVVARRKALVDHVARRGWDAEVVDGAIGANRLIRHLPDPAPEVTVIVPTRDRAALLRVAARGVLEDTAYPRLKLLIADNDSVEPDTHALFEELKRDRRVTVMPAPGPFNFSKLNNDAVALTTSEVLCFLNNDIEVIDRDWLRELVSCLVPGVGAVGAKLLYPNRTVQHAGVILGAGGVAGHAFLDLSQEDPGYFGRAVLPQYVSAVTGACLLMRRQAFDEAGGFDAERLTIAFNDIDLCLKVRERGWKIVFDPYAVLIHHESVSRGQETTAAKRARFESEISTMLERWGPTLKRDPYYNPNLELDFADFRLRGHKRPSPPRFGQD